ncbi:MAG: hypothetical protein GX023_06840 [Tissierellia bacterium]|nr:hypothetical protein [Tissierellia bacterium]
MEVKRASILLLETGELEDVDIDYHTLDKNYNEIRDFIDFVQNNNNIKDYEKNCDCNGDCIYNILCNLW